MNKRLIVLILFVSVMFCVSDAFSAEVEKKEDKKVEKEAERHTEKVQSNAGESHLVLKKILFYFPNRFFDLLDIFRARVSVGPGLSATARVTEYGSCYIGQHDTLYVGLPGARHPKKIKTPIWIESEKGFKLFGVDATDTSKYNPKNSSTEIAAGVHLLVVGADIGIDAFEVSDFIAGLVFIDLRGDDLGSPSKPDHIAGRMVELNTINAGKPDSFDGFADRLEYVRTNLTWMNSRVQRFDSMFAGEDVQADLTPPISKFMLGLYIELEEDDGWGLGIDPDFSMDVALPNLEKKYRLYVSGKGNSDLPGTNPSERDGGSRIGVSRQLGDWGFGTDAGIKWDWPPALYTGVEWKYFYALDGWRLRPSVRAYYETEDGLGQVSSLSAYKWLGAAKKFAFRTTSAMKWEEEEERGWEWEQGLSFAYIPGLIDSAKADTEVSLKDVARGYGIRYSILGYMGDVDSIDRHRVTFAYRCPMYSDWIFLSLEPEFEWQNETDWDMISRFRVGMDLLFWGG